MPILKTKYSQSTPAIETNLGTLSARLVFDVAGLQFHFKFTRGKTISDIWLSHDETRSLIDCMQSYCSVCLNRAANRLGPCDAHTFKPCQECRDRLSIGLGFCDTHKPKTRLPDFGSD